MRIVRRSWLRSLIVAALLAGTSTAEQDQPHMVFVLIDDLGYGDFGVTGNKTIPTPNIDRLAKQGTLIEQFYVGSPICSPSRVAFMTGQFPAQLGIHSYLAGSRRNKARGMRNWLNPKTLTLPGVLKASGYTTAHFGKWHMGGGRDVGNAPLPSAYGFDEHLTAFEGLGDRLLINNHGLSKQSAKLKRGKITWLPKHKLTENHVDRAIGFLNKNHKRKPCYVQVWLNDVHDPHLPKEADLTKFAKFKENPFKQKFYAVLTETDRQIGRLVTAIDKLGIGKNTLFVLTGDNGPTAWPRYYKQGFDPPGSTAGLRGRKWSLYEGGIRQPLILRQPGRVPAGRVDSKSVVTAVDFFPTLCTIGGCQLPDIDLGLDGEDRGVVFAGTSSKRKTAIIWEYGRDASYLRPGKASDRSPNLAIRQGDWKFLMNADGTSPELYNLVDDPKESKNAAAKRPKIAKRMRAALQQRWRSVPQSNRHPQAR